MSKQMWLSTLGVAALLHSGAEAQQPAMPMQQEVQTAITRMLHAIDALDWRAVRTAFTPRVRIDYSSLFGGSAADSLIARWRSLLPGFDATQHLIGPVIVTLRSGSLTAETQARGYHFIEGAEGGAVWMAAGRYEFSMEQTGDGWKISGITFRLAYQEGNLSFPRIAQARAAAGQGRRATKG